MLIHVGVRTKGVMHIYIRCVYRYISLHVCVCAGMSGHKKVHDPARESSGFCRGAVTSTLAGPGSEARGAGWSGGPGVVS